MEQDNIILQFRKHCKVVYNYYRVKMIKQTPYNNPQAPVTSNHIDNFLTNLEGSVNDMDKLSRPIVSKYPQLQSALTFIMYFYTKKYNALSVSLRKRFNKDA